MRCPQLARRSGRSPKDDRTIELSARHLSDLGGIIYDLIDSYQRKIKGHKLDNGPIPDHGGAYPDSRKTKFRYRRIYDPFRPKLIQHSFRGLIGPIIFRNFLSH